LSTVIAIDPGTTESGYVVFDGNDILDKGKITNREMRDVLKKSAADHCAIEMVANYGMPSGHDIHQTLLWTGRFIECWIEAWNAPYTLVYRREVKLLLCNSVRAKDANIRQALIDRIGKPGTSKNPGPTFGVVADIWSALGVAVWWHDQLPPEDPDKPW